MKDREAWCAWGGEEPDMTSRLNNNTNLYVIDEETLSYKL